MRKLLVVFFTLLMALALTALPAFAQVDTDGDGIVDGSDACPLNGDAGNGVAADGCPILVAAPDGGLVAAPVDGTVSCAGSLAPVLTVGQTGQIASRFSTLRHTPAGRVIRVVYAPATFTVLEGPVCGGFGPLTWYLIRYENGDEGWASESQKTSIYGNNQYWLEAAEVE
ncbi:MAG: hypothetical protein SGI73_22250 [Chloroflexota bacterium]|nr:hypothetical protein [Chloroflexota bacterium]